MTTPKTTRTRTLSTAALLGSALLLTTGATTADTDYYDGDLDALLEQLDDQLTVETEIEGEHIFVSAAHSEYLLAPNQSAYWTVSAVSAFGEDATATADLSADGTFGADITIIDARTAEVLLNEHTADIDGTIDFDAFDLAQGRDYVVEIQADENTPEQEELMLELSVHAEGETIPVTPEPQPEPEPQPVPTTPEEPAPEEDTEPAPPESEEAPPEEQEAPVPSEEEPAARSGQTIAEEVDQPTINTIEEQTETPTIASGIIAEENRGLFLAALSGLVVGVGAIAYGSVRAFKKKTN